MCHLQPHFKLCTCADESLELPKTYLGPPQFSWHLARYQGEADRVGKMLLPAYSIGQGLDADYVGQELNKPGCFDFEYTPVEGDYLIIRKIIPEKEDYATFSRPEDKNYLAFIFRNGQWTEDYYGVSAITENIGNGKLKLY